MAVTDIHPISVTLDKSIEYIINPQKTKGGELVLDYGGSVQKIELYAVNDVGELEEEKSGTERFIYYLSQLFKKVLP